jgi:steroid delta-isomerase-like uncharacterized protein
MTMSTDRNSRTARRYWEDLFTAGDLAVADEIIAPEWTIHNPGVPANLRGPAGVKQMVGMFRAAFPDLRIEVEEQVVDGEHVLNRYTARGTHLGPFQGIPATGRPVTVTGLAIDRIVDGRLVERWGHFDTLGLLRQLGVVPA